MRIISAAVLVLLSSCAPNDDLSALSPVDEDESSLVSGREARLDEFPSLVFLQFSDGVCSGTKVGPRHVLTAAHCLDTEDGTIAKSADRGASVTLRNAATPSGATYVVEVAETHPARRRSCETEGCGHDDAAFDHPDVGLLIFAEDVKGETSSVLTSPLSTGDAVTVTGFGCAEVGGEGTGVLRVHEDVIAAPSSAAGLFSGVSREGAKAQSQRFYFTRGRSPITGRGASLCRGDSGGPLLARVEGGVAVAGVNSRLIFAEVGSLRFQQVNWHARVDDASKETSRTWLRGWGVSTTD